MVVIIKMTMIMTRMMMMITLISMRSSFSLHFMLVYSFATLFIFFWLMFRLHKRHNQHIGHGNEGGDHNNN